MNNNKDHLIVQLTTPPPQGLAAEEQILSLLYKEVAPLFLLSLVHLQLHLHLPLFLLSLVRLQQHAQSPLDLQPERIVCSLSHLQATHPLVSLKN